MPKRFLTLVMLISAGLLVCSAAAPANSPAVRRVLDQLTPQISALILIDYQPQYTFSTRSTDIDSLINNAVALTNAARVFKVPTIVTTITAESFAGPLLQPIHAVTGAKPIDRTLINAWHDERFIKAVRASGRKKLVMAGLWTDNCLMLPALYALAEGFEVYVATDASGDYDAASHERAVQRLAQAGAVPITWLPVMLEWQADWARAETSPAVNQIIREHAAAMAAGGQYRQAFVR